MSDEFPELEPFDILPKSSSLKKGLLSVMLLSSNTDTNYKNRCQSIKHLVEQGVKKCAVLKGMRLNEHSSATSLNNND